jgi:PAS domain-containing protein
VIQKPFWECHWWSHREDVMNELREAVAKASRGEVVRYDTEVRMAEDSRLTIDFMIVPVRDADGTITHLIPSGVDVSDRVRAEQEIKNASAKLRVLFDQAFYYTGLLDLDGNLTDINDAALKPFDFERKDVIGLPFWKTPWWKDQHESQKKLQSGFAEVLNGEVYHEELAFVERAIDSALAPNTTCSIPTIAAVARQIGQGSPVANNQHPKSFVFSTDEHADAIATTSACKAGFRVERT